MNAAISYLIMFLLFIGCATGVITPHPKAAIHQQRGVELLAADRLDEAEQKIREPLDEIQEALQEKKEIFLAAVEAGKQAAEDQAELQRQAKG